MILASSLRSFRILREILPFKLSLFYMRTNYKTKLVLSVSISIIMYFIRTLNEIKVNDLSFVQFNLTQETHEPFL